VNAWGAIQYVGTGLSLVAFAIAAIPFAYNCRALAVEYKMLAARASEDMIPHRSATKNLSSGAGEREAG
jgi:hypothetical protein